MERLDAQLYNLTGEAPVKKKTSSSYSTTKQYPASSAQGVHTISTEKPRGTAPRIPIEEEDDDDDNSEYHEGNAEEEDDKGGDDLEDADDTDLAGEEEIGNGTGKFNMTDTFDDSVFDLLPDDDVDLERLRNSQLTVPNVDTDSHSTDNPFLLGEPKPGVDDVFACLLDSLEAGIESQSIRVTAAHRRKCEMDPLDALRTVKGLPS